MGYLSDLNSEQRKAVCQTEGPVLVLAGAGSGKTRTLTYKIAHLIALDQARPEQILAVTFTNKAAEAMRDRVGNLLRQQASAPLICTFHSFAVRLLRRHAGRLDYGSDFAICDRDDQKRVLKRVYEELQLPEIEMPAARVLAIISWAKNQNWGPETYLQESPHIDAPEIARVFTTYQNQLRRSNAMDFDDLLLMSVELLRESEPLAQRYSRQYRYLLIDEYQDTNPPQYELIRLLSSSHRNVTAVGDEDQSIYGFRGADISNILRFESDFPGAVVVRLEENYRSTQNILDAATGVVTNNKKRKGKVLWTRKSIGEPLALYVADDAFDEARFVAWKIQEHLRGGGDGLAVLYRTNFQSRQIEDSLRRAQISYRLVGATSFYSRKEIKDALAYLRVANNPNDDVSLLRIINTPPRGLGRASMKRLEQVARERSCSYWRAIEDTLGGNAVPGRMHLALERFCESLRAWTQHLSLPLHIGLDKILRASGYTKALQDRDTPENRDRLQNLDELLMVAREYWEKGRPIQDFLDYAALYSESDQYDASAPVTLMTLHNAKGLEFPVVFLTGCEEGLFPHSRSIAEDDLEEERRLCYVGLTRAQERLYLSYCRRRRSFGRETDELNRPSRFLGEIPEHLIAPLSTFGYQPTGHFSARKKTAPFTRQTYDSVESVQKWLGRGERGGAPGANGWVSGARIVHGNYGRGQILQVQNLGDDLKVTVRFPGIGIKKMLQSYAKLRLIH